VVRGRDPRAEGGMKSSLTMLLMWLVLAPSLDPRPAAAQRRALTIEEYLALPSVGDPQVSPDGKWVAYTVTRYSLKENRGATRIWLTDVAGGLARPPPPRPRAERPPPRGPARRPPALLSPRPGGGQLGGLPLPAGDARAATRR